MKKVAFITGGTGGLGLTIVQDLLERGYEVVSISRDAARIEGAKKLVASEKAVFLKGDIITEEALSDVYHYLLDRYGYVNVLINNVGIMAAHVRCECSCSISSNKEAASPDQTCGIWMCCEYLFHRF